MASGTDIATAYVQIIPSAEGIKGKLEEIMGGEADSAGKKSGGKFGQAFGNVLKTAGKIGAAAIGAAATGIGALTKSAITAYADYEQLVGGVETLFGAGGQSLQEYAQSVGKSSSLVADEYGKMMTAQNTVLRNAADAYKTAGLSSNEYMETVTSFSAALIKSVGGDSLKAAKLADQAIRDMSDNANKMGTDMASIQNAYQGFAKQNYTMLDNLKLGYGGTKDEMTRLVSDAEKLNAEFRVSRDINGNLVYSYADIVRAINIVQTEMGITGTTAKEASSTISGSIGMMKGAWANLVAGFGDSNADMERLFGDLVSSAETVLGNLLPVAEQALGGIANAIGRLAPVIAERLPGLVTQILPPLMSAATEIVTALAGALVTNLPVLLPVAIDAIQTISTGLLTPENIRLLVDAALLTMEALVDGFIDALPVIIDAITTVIVTIAERLSNPDTIKRMLDSAWQIVKAIATGLWEAMPQILSALGQMLAGMLTGIREWFQPVMQKGREIVKAVKDGFMEKIHDAVNWGRDLIQNFINGILEKWNNLKQTISNVAQTIKNFIGFSEPKEGPLSNFHTYAPDMMELFAKGIRDNEPLVTNQLKKSFDFSTAISAPSPIDITGRYGAVGGYGYGPAYNYGGVTIVIEGRDKDAAQLARELQTELTRRTAGFDPWRATA